jgi:hypothetical protein
MRGRVDTVRVHARQTALCLIELTLGGEFAIRSQADGLADSKVSTGLFPAASIGEGKRSAKIPATFHRGMLIAQREKRTCTKQSDEKSTLRLPRKL